MDLTLAMTLDTLRKAQVALRSELDVQTLAPVLDEGRLVRLRDLARDFQRQAHSALVMMLYEDVPEALQQETETLVGNFGDVVTHIDAMLAWDPRRTRPVEDQEGEDTPMTDRSKASSVADARIRVRALEEAAAEALRLATEWRDDVDGTHSSHHSDLRRTWADAAERVAEAIAALARQGGSEEPKDHIPQHKRPHHL